MFMSTTCSKFLKETGVWKLVGSWRELSCPDGFLFIRGYTIAYLKVAGTTPADRLLVIIIRVFGSIVYLWDQLRVSQDCWFPVEDREL